MKKRRRIALALVAVTGVAALMMAGPAEANGGADQGTAPSLKWYRGNTHTHTFWSDGNHFAEAAASWYKKNGYQFVVLTDHNNRPTKEGWKNLSRHEQNRPGEKLAEEFGHDHVKTKKDAEGNTLYRLMDYDEIAKLLNEKDTFCVVPGEELTDHVDHNPVHMSAINTAKTIGVKRQATVLETAMADAARVVAHAKAHKRPVFLQLNHPNWRWDMTAEVLAEVTDADGFELVNPNCHNTGDTHSPSSERMWDVAATLRMKKFNAKPIWAVAADDTHNYHEFDKLTTKANPGRAFVMVRAPELTGNTIATALKAGAFYASTGVILKTATFDRKTRELTVEVDPADGGKSYTIEFYGTPKDISIESTPAPAHTDIIKEEPVARKITRVYSKEIGKLLQTVKGETTATFKLPDDLLYVRCKVTDMSHKGFNWGNGEIVPRAAWTQPVGWELALAEFRKATAKAKK